MFFFLYRDSCCFYIPAKLGIFSVEGYENGTNDAIMYVTVS